MIRPEQDTFIRRRAAARHNLVRHPNLPEIAPAAGFIVTANIPLGNFQTRPSQPLSTRLGEFPNTVTLTVPGTPYYRQTVLNYVPESQADRVLQAALDQVDDEPDNPLGQLRTLGEYFHQIYLERSIHQELRPPVCSLATELYQHCLDMTTANLLFQLASAEAGFSTNLALYGLPDLDNKGLSIYVFTTFVNPETGAKMVYEPQTNKFDTWLASVTNAHLPFLGDGIAYQEKRIVNFYPLSPESP